MLDGFRIEARELNNDEIVLLAEEGDIRISAKIPCALIDRLSATPPVTFNDRLDVMRRNLVVFAAIVQEKFNAGQFRAYHGLEGRDRWIVLEKRDLTDLRLL